MGTKNKWLIRYGGLGLLSLALVPVLFKPQGGQSLKGQEPAVPRIAVTPGMLTNEEGRSNAAWLFDEPHRLERAFTDDPAAPVTQWSPGPEPDFYPANAFLDLGATYHLTDVFLFDGEGEGAVTLSAGSPFAWTPVLNDPMPHDNQWNRHRLDVRTRYLRITLTSPNSTPELVLYGTRADTTAPVVPVEQGRLAKAPQPTMDQFIGVNSFIDVPLEINKAAGFIREYHDWEWNEGKAPGQTRYNPAYPGWNFDAYYATLKAAGIAVSPCLQGSVSWLTPQNQDKPLNRGADPADPFSYRSHASALFQYAARYGSRALAPKKLITATGQPGLSGLGLLSSFEDWNEPNKWWQGSDAQFLPYQYAAMASADYDGHQGRMGEGYGVKNADPAATFVMGGLAGIDVNYIKAMKAWADFHRGGSFPADVLNVHHYSNNQKEYDPAGISPEADGLKEKLQALVAYRDAHLPDQEVWLSEFGYDVHPTSPQRAPAIGDYSPEEVQGQWLVRSYLALAASGIDRAIMYMVRDHDSGSPGQYASCGLVTDKAGGHAPRPAWYYVYTLKNVLAGTRFRQEIVSGNPDVRVYQFEHVRDDVQVYVVWCPTSTGKVVEKYTFALPSDLTGAYLTELKAGSTNPVPVPLAVTGGKVSHAVSERPVFITVKRNLGT